VCVHPGADESEAKQSNANILLSRRAEVDTKPELEIYADEVIASHGATVGQLDEQAIFYMRSRGLREQQARQLLTTAFCQSVSDKLSDRILGDIISQSMMAVMPEFDQT
jgi:Fe-S cluster assembly protein SufD